jgi:type II secretory ATPase GspE/PulE/Tfp pilus assembly ATPase PilB-like protein
LVLSTLHTNHAAETINRLQSMGIAAYHLVSSLSLIIAQRLVRILCIHCKQPEILPVNLHKLIPEHIAYQAVGCKHCHHGYHGRIGVFECLPITDNIAQLILSGASTKEIMHHASQAGWPTLWDAGIAKVRDTTTSYAEIVRVIGTSRHDHP